jgi:hypothetical protein
MVQKRVPPPPRAAPDDRVERIIDLDRGDALEILREIQKESDSAEGDGYTVDTTAIIWI